MTIEEEDISVHTGGEGGLGHEAHTSIANLDEECNNVRLVGTHRLLLLIWLILQMIFWSWGCFGMPLNKGGEAAEMGKKGGAEYRIQIEKENTHKHKVLHFIITFLKFYMKRVQMHLDHNNVMCV